jgi:two-component system phosphate regulon sensor histidine kinase PhoR
MWYSLHIYKQNYLATMMESVAKYSNLLTREFTILLAHNEPTRVIDSICDERGKDIDYRLTIILPDGKVTGDSKANPDTMENHQSRPEIGQALQGRTDKEVRYSTTLKEDLLYYASPLLADDNSVRGVLRIAVPLGTIKKHEYMFYHRLLIVSSIVFVILGFTILIFTSLLSKPIKLMRTGAQRFAAGDFHTKLVIPKSEEFGELARTLNSMAVSLDERIQTITRQKNELNAILESLNEGVIAVDNNERIISLNPAAARILNIKQENAPGFLIPEIVRNSTLQKFLISSLSSKERIETAFSLSTPDGDISIQAYGTLLFDHNKQPQGAVLVLNDITRIKKLENLRKDFVANVSHELRTPLTSIKGFVETIRCGDYNLPDDVNRFLDIISSKTDNLCSIVEDILTLSSIERDNEHREINMAYSNIRSILQDAISTCHYKAVQKNIRLHMSCPSDLHSCVNAPLLEQAVVNLLDNAIKYSNEHTEIHIDALTQNDEFMIRVTDHGCGIAEEHQSRVFERFYRVDKARSRKLGGTGLGLSIVKNIATAHGGNVLVHSKTGEGSAFEIHLPIVKFEKE